MTNALENLQSIFRMAAQLFSLITGGHPILALAALAVAGGGVWVMVEIFSVIP